MSSVHIDAVAAHARARALVCDGHAHAFTLSSQHDGKGQGRHRCPAASMPWHDSYGFEGRTVKNGHVRPRDGALGCDRPRQCGGHDEAAAAASGVAAPCIATLCVRAHTSAGAVGLG